MNINDIFPSKFLKAADLKGREPTVVIERLEMEQLGEQRKLVIYFQGKEKGLVCNRTNADRIAYMYSPDTDGWIGKEITLYADMVTFQGRTMEALRVKPPKKYNAAKPAAPPPATEPFADDVPDFGPEDFR